MRMKRIWAGIVSGLALVLMLSAKFGDDIGPWLTRVFKKTPAEIAIDTGSEIVKRHSKIENIIEALSKKQNDTTTPQPEKPQIFNRISQSRKGRISNLKQAQDLTVTVGFWDQEKKKWIEHGSGFLVGDNLCATNVHVIAGHREIAVKPYDTQKWYPVRSRAKYDRYSHIVILKSKEDMGRLSFHLSRDYSPAYGAGHSVTVVDNQSDVPHFVKCQIADPFEGELLNAIQNQKRSLILPFLDDILDAWSDVYGKTGFIIKSSLTSRQSGVPVINNAFEVEGIVVADVSLLHFIPQYKEQYKKMREELDKMKGDLFLSDRQLFNKFFPDSHDFVVPVIYLYWLLAVEKQWVRLPISIDPVFE